MARRPAIGITMGDAAGIGPLVQQRRFGRHGKIVRQRVQRGERFRREGLLGRLFRGRMLCDPCKPVCDPCGSVTKSCGACY